MFLLVVIHYVFKYIFLVIFTSLYIVLVWRILSISTYKYMVCLYCSALWGALYISCIVIINIIRFLVTLTEQRLTLLNLQPNSTTTPHYYSSNGWLFHKGKKTRATTPVHDWTEMTTVRGYHVFLCSRCYTCMVNTTRPHQLRVEEQRAASSVNYVNAGLLSGSITNELPGNLCCGSKHLRSQCNLSPGSPSGQRLDCTGLSCKLLPRDGSARPWADKKTTALTPYLLPAKVNVVQSWRRVR